MIDTTSQFAGQTAPWASPAPSNTSGVAPLTTKVTNAPTGFDLPAGSTLSGNYSASSGTLKPTSATVVTPAKASSDLSAIQGSTANILQGMNNQSLTVANNEANNPKPAPAPEPTKSTSVADVLSTLITPPGQLSTEEQIKRGYKFDQNTGQPLQTDTSTDTSVSPTNSQSSPSDTENANYQSNVNGIQSDQQSAFQTYQDTVNQLRSGVFPLSTTEQALVDSTNNSFQRLEAQQAIANQNLVAGTTQANIVSGRQRYAPEIALGEINQAVNTGIAKVADIESQRVQAVAKLQQGFEDEDYKMITDSYNAYQDLSKNKLDTLTKMHDDVVAQESGLRSYNLQVGAQKLEQAKFVEQQKTDQATIQHQQISDSLAQANYKLEKSKFNATYGAFVDDNGNLKTDLSASDIPGMTKLNNGMSVINLDSVPSEVSGAVKGLAGKAGILPLTQADITKVNDTANLVNTVNQLQTLYNTIKTGVGGSTDIFGGNSQVGANASNVALTQYVNLRDTLPPNVQSSIPGLTTNPFTRSFVDNGDTASGMTGFTTARNTLNQSISSLVPGAQVPPYGSVFSDPQSAQKYFTSTGQTNEYQSEVDKANTKAQEKFGRNANDGEILQVINGQ